MFEALGHWLDSWIPRVLKVLGLVGFGLALVLAGKGDFQPFLLAASLVAATGGYAKDVLSVLKPPSGPGGA